MFMSTGDSPVLATMGANEGASGVEVQLINVHYNQKPVGRPLMRCHHTLQLGSFTVREYHSKRRCLS